MTELLVERRERVAILTIAREARANALSRGLLAEFGHVRQQLEADDQLRAIVITGAGDKAFCAGADLKERASMSHAEVRSMLLEYEHSLGWLAHSRRPVVAAINGAALGGGLELALLCDLRMASPHAVFGLPETGLGIIPGAGGTQRLPRVVGRARATEMILLGSRLSAEQALEVGLVHRLSPDRASLLEATLEWIEPILSGAPIAQAAALAALEALELPLAQGLERERQLYEQCLDSEDRQEALAAFKAKRKPVFQGR